MSLAPHSLLFCLIPPLPVLLYSLPYTLILLLFYFIIYIIPYRFRIWLSNPSQYTNIIHRVTAECSPLIANGLCILGDPNEIGHNLCTSRNTDNSNTNTGTTTTEGKALHQEGKDKDTVDANAKLTEGNETKDINSSNNNNRNNGVVIVQCSEMLRFGYHDTESYRLDMERRWQYEWASGASIVETPYLQNRKTSTNTNTTTTAGTNNTNTNTTNTELVRSSSKYPIDFSLTEILPGSSTSTNLRWCLGCRVCIKKALAKHNKGRADEYYKYLTNITDNEYETCDDECIRQRRIVTMTTPTHLERIELSLPHKHKAYHHNRSSLPAPYLTLPSINGCSLFPPVDPYDRDHPSIDYTLRNEPTRMYCHERHTHRTINREVDHNVFRRFKTYGVKKNNSSRPDVDLFIDPRPIVLTSPEQQKYFNSQVKALYGDDRIQKEGEVSTFVLKRSSLPNISKVFPSYRSWYDPWWYHLRLADFQWALPQYNSTGSLAEDEKESVIPCTGMVCLPRMDYPNKLKKQVKSFISPGKLFEYTNLYNQL